MAIQVTIDNITGQTPYDIYICQTGGTGCFYMTTISSVPYSFDIPSPYDTSLAYMVKIIDNNGCVISGQSSVLSVCPSLTPNVTPTNTKTPTPTPTITPTNTTTPTPTPTNVAIVCTSCVQLTGGIVNGVTVGVSYSGNVQPYPFGPITGCTSVFTPANSIWVGQVSNFSLTFNFSQPVNNLVFFIDGYDIPETFTFTTNTGTPTISSPENCGTLISGNQISSSGGFFPANRAGKFVINNISNYTSLTITGPGGSSGSTLALCTDSIV